MPLTTSTIRAGRVDAALRVFPLGAGLVLHWRGEPERDQIGERLGLLRGRARRLAEPGRMREDLRDREIRRLARGRLQVRELGQILRHGISDRELALILQHQNRDAGDRLGHRGDPEQRVGRHRTFRRDIGETGRLDVENLILCDDGGDSAGDFVLRDHRLHRGADARQLRLRSNGDQGGGQGKDGDEAMSAHADMMYPFCWLVVKQSGDPDPAIRHVPAVLVPGPRCGPSWRHQRTPGASRLSRWSRRRRPLRCRRRQEAALRPRRCQ